MSRPAPLLSPSPIAQTRNHTAHLVQAADRGKQQCRDHARVVPPRVAVGLCCRRRREAVVRRKAGGARRQRRRRRGVVLHELTRHPHGVRRQVI